VVTRVLARPRTAEEFTTPPHSNGELVEAFEACTLPAGEFRHRDHVRVMWLSLSTRSVLHTLERFPSALRRYTDSLGKPDLYPEAITWAPILLIDERRRRGDPASSWEVSRRRTRISFPGPESPSATTDRERSPVGKRESFFLVPDRIEPGASESGPRIEVGKTSG